MIPPWLTLHELTPEEGGGYLAKCGLGLMVTGTGDTKEEAIRELGDCLLTIVEHLEAERDTAVKELASLRSAMFHIRNRLTGMYDTNPSTEYLVDTIDVIDKALGNIKMEDIFRQSPAQESEVEG